MIIGIESLIGSTVIAGEQEAAGSLVENALLTFQGVGSLPAGSQPEDAVAFARNFADRLRQMTKLPDQIVRGFPNIHSRLCSRAAVVPTALHAAYDSFQREPTLAGAATYFNVLADAMSQEPPRKKPKPPAR